MTTLHPVAGNEPIDYDWEKAWEKPQPAAPNLTIRPITVNGASAYGKKALDQELAILANTPEGSRNHQLFKSAAALAELVASRHLSDQATRQELYRTAIAIGLTPSETRSTIASGFTAGLQQPRAVPELKPKIHSAWAEVDGQYVNTDTGEVVTPLEQPGPNVAETPPTTNSGEHTEPETQSADYTWTDDGNALKLVAERGHLVRRVADMKRWFVWDGCRWALDHEDRAIREAARDLARLLPSGTKEASRFKHNSMSATGVSSCVRLAETDTRVSILAANLDAHPELINTPAGVVDLRTGTVKPHNPDLLLTRITAYGVDLQAPHPRWDAFLKETFDGDAALISYIRRLAGLALLGNVREHILPFNHGTGANGKGVLTLVLQGLLGDADSGGYAVSAPDGFLMTGRDGAHPTEIARLRGARLVVCSEQTSGKRFDEQKVKRLTGGDVLTGRFMRGDFFDFPPSHLTWVLSNHLPAVREGGPSFWRRVRKIPFLHVVPEEQRIPDLHEQLLADEGPAILGWAVRGAVEVLANGLNDPDSVIKATREYEISEDSLASFVEDECQVGPYYWCTVSDFRHRYEQHCEEMGADPLTAKALTMRLTTEYAVTSGKAAKGLRVYRGIELPANTEDQP